MDDEETLAEGRPTFEPGRVRRPTAADFDDDERPQLTRNAARSGASPERANGAVHGAPRAGRKARRLPVQVKALGAGALAMGVLLGIYVSSRPATANTSLPASHPAIGASAAPSATPTPVDQARVAALTAKVAENSRDTASLQALADLYAASDDYDNAATWQKRLVDVQPTDTDSRTILGVYYFNLQDAANAEAQWQEVVRQDPKKQEAYYDLGYLYLVKDPAENDKAIAAWQKVIDIDPTTQMAKSVSEHMSSIGTATASPTPSATPSR